MLKKYELALIIKPSLNKEEISKDVISVIKKKIEDLKGKVLENEDWGMRKMTYTIEKNDSGYYYFLNFELDQSSLQDLEKSLKLNNNLLRSLIEIL